MLIESPVVVSLKDIAFLARPDVGSQLGQRYVEVLLGQVTVESVLD